MGTRFLAIDELGAHPVYKDCLLKAEARDTVLTGLFDVGWEELAAPRAPQQHL